METGGGYEKSEVHFSENAFMNDINVEELDAPYKSIEAYEKRGLSPAEKKAVKKESGWSDTIRNSIGSMEEYKIYREAGLAEETIGEKTCLIRPDIDMEQTDAFGRSNQERMEQGLAPLTREGRPYELHHIGQHQDSPLAELTMQEHRGKGNDTILHIKVKESEIDREEFGFERAAHWQNRAGDEREREESSFERAAHRQNGAGGEREQEESGFERAAHWQNGAGGEMEQEESGFKRAAHWQNGAGGEREHE